MDLFHDDLLNLSFQQNTLGQLPRGLIREIHEARSIALDIFKHFDRSKVQEIDYKVYEQQNYWPENLVLEFSKRKLYSKWLPKFLGGGGAHPLGFYGLNFEMGASCLGISNLLGAHYVALGLISATSSLGILKKIIGEIRTAESNGTHCSISIAITEPGAGSDMEDPELMERGQVGTKATKVQGGYEITGQKIFISNSLFSKWYVGSAFENLSDPTGSLIIFVTPSNAKGITIGRTELKLGQSASPANVIFFDKVFIPQENICFAKEQFDNPGDFKQNAECLLNDLLSLSRAGVSCLATGFQKRLLEIITIHLKKTKLDEYEWAKAQAAKVVQHFVVSKTVSWEAHIECYGRGPYKDLHKPAIYYFLKYTPTWILSKLLDGVTSTKMRSLLRKKRIKSIKKRDEKLILGWGSLSKSFCSSLGMKSAYLTMEMLESHGELFWELEKGIRDFKLLEIYEGTNELNLLTCYKSFIGPTDILQNIFKDGA